MAETLANPWFWTGIVLVLIFFLATLVEEEASFGQRLLLGLNQLSAPPWSRTDDFMRCVVPAFSEAIFAVVGVYLSPDLQTPAEVISWAQLVIVALIFSRRTQPLAALGILLLWAMALRDYDLSHLLDDLALGIAVAG